MGAKSASARSSRTPAVIVVGRGPTAVAVVRALAAERRPHRAVPDATAAARLLAAGEVSAVTVAVPLPPATLGALHQAAGRRDVPISVAVARADGTVTTHPLPPATPLASPRVKRALDVAIAAALLAASAPLWLVLAAAIRAESAGPVFFAQERVGRGGRRFRLWKFRTMHEAAPAYARSPSDGDARVTRVGRLIRPAGLDELPQLASVLRGDMSLVGPRPEMAYVVEQYTPLQRHRLDGVPGLTGLWQLRGDRSRPMHEQVELDLAYLATRSAPHDLQLIGETAVYAVRGLVGAVRRGWSARRGRATASAEAQRAGARG